MNIKELNEELNNLMTMNTVTLLHNLIAEENSAVASYTEKAKIFQEMGQEDIAKVLLDIADEELVHAGEIQELLNRKNLSGKTQLDKGKEEVEELLREE